MARMQSRPVAEPPLLRIEPFKGMDSSVTPTQILESQSPDMLNMNIDERGALNKRTGYERVYVRTVGEGKINGMFHWRKGDSEKILFSHGGSLYASDGIPSIATNTRLSTWDDDDLDETWEV